MSAADSLVALRFDARLNVNQETGCPEIGEFYNVDGVQRKWLDANCDGEVDPVDALVILRFDAATEFQPAARLPGDRVGSNGELTSPQSSKIATEGAANRGPLVYL